MKHERGGTFGCLPEARPEYANFYLQPYVPVDRDTVVFLADLGTVAVRTELTKKEAIELRDWLSKMLDGE